MILGYTSGVFDMFHIGHLNILRNAKGLCDKLIVGVSTDELVEKYKGSKPRIPFHERMAILSNLGFIDIVVTQSTIDKFEIWKRIKFDVFVMAEDWIETKGRKEQINKLKRVGVRTYLLPRTPNISTTILKNGNTDS